MWIKSTVVMLPTNIEAKMPKDCQGKIFINDDKVASNLTDLEDIMKSAQWFGARPYDLYFCTKDQIKTSDWYMDDTEAIRQAVTSDLDYWSRRPDYKKIIASTDRDLKLPRPSQPFVLKFIRERNNGNTITEVLVEYEEQIESACTCDTVEKLYACPHYMSNEFCSKRFADGEFWHRWNAVKISEDNTITIRKIKDSWNREEVVDLCERAWQAALNKANDPNGAPGFTLFIQQNL